MRGTLLARARTLVKPTRACASSSKSTSVVARQASTYVARVQRVANRPRVSPSLSLPRDWTARRRGFGAGGASPSSPLLPSFRALLSTRAKDGDGSYDEDDEDEDVSESFFVGDVECVCDVMVIDEDGHEPAEVAKSALDIMALRKEVEADACELVELLVKNPAASASSWSRTSSGETRLRWR